MVKFTLKYQPAIKAYTGDIDNKLVSYHLSDRDWEIVRQLGKVLRVRSHFNYATYHSHSTMF